LNYLAHLFLSGEDQDLLIGNFIADGVKGNKVNDFSPGIIKGIKLHRFIDTFTDTHPIVEESKIRLREKYKKYAGVIVDVFYDHFLAKNWEQFSSTPLIDYTQDVYTVLNRVKSVFPEKIKYMLPFMIKHNWLYAYKEIEGIDKALKGMARRTTFVANMENASIDLRKDYELFENEFVEFFPVLIKHSNQYELL
jgi:acyl carrier protein phosphodiesterase